MIRRITRAILVFGCAAAALIAAPTARKSAPGRYAMPPLPPGKFWITSVPVGLDVYFAEKPEGKPVGRTPILVDATSVGSAVTVKLSKAVEPNLPPQEEFVEVTSQSTHGEFHEDERTGVRSPVSVALTYRVDPSRKRTLIALFQPRSATLSDWARRYPAGRNFVFSEENVRKNLLTRGVPPSLFDLAIDLLHRGGKVGLPAKNGWVVFEVLSSGAVRAIG
jgi:hypothetical protein